MLKKKHSYLFWSFAVFRLFQFGSHHWFGLKMQRYLFLFVHSFCFFGLYVDPNLNSCPQRWNSQWVSNYVLIPLLTRVMTHYPLMRWAESEILVWSFCSETRWPQVCHQHLPFTVISFFRFGLHLFVSVTDIIFVCRIRDDKTAEDATNAEQIAEMYRNQDVVKNQQNGNGKTTSVEDDFDFWTRFVVFSLLKKNPWFLCKTNLGTSAGCVYTCTCRKIVIKYL